MNPRTLKIEMAGDFFRRKTHPKIRLQGQWLARLGFPPGSHVQVVPGNPGELLLCLVSREGTHWPESR